MQQQQQDSFKTIACAPLTPGKQPHLRYRAGHVGVPDPARRSGTHWAGTSVGTAGLGWRL